jgi:PAS domain S-box-containing protein
MHGSLPRGSGGISGYLFRERKQVWLVEGETVRFYESIASYGGWREIMSKSALADKRIGRAVWRYGLAVLSVAFATAVTFPLQSFGVKVSLYFPAVLLSTWFGGAGPGVLAVLLSAFAINFFFTEPFFEFDFTLRDLPTTLAFLFSALLISSWSNARKRVEKRLSQSEDALRKARDELENKVAERTAELSQSNEQLRLQIAERKEAEEKLRSSEAFLAQGQRISQTGSWHWDVATGTVGWSEEHFRIFGFDPEKTESSYKLFVETVHPEDREFVARALDEAVRDKSDFDLEFRIALADRSIKHVHGVGRALPNESGEVERYIGTTVDISARKRAELLLAGEKQLLEMVATGDSLTLVLDALCRLVEELAPGAVSSVLLLDPNGNKLRHGAAPSLPKAYTDAIDGLTIGPAVGSCGTAAYRGKPVIVPEIATDPRWADYRDFALPHGLRACWSTPILSSEGKVLGTFAIYYREPRTPTPEQREIIEQITHLASIALERKRAEEALRASEQVARGQAETLAQSLDVLATAPDPEKFLGQMLGTIGRLLNAHSSMVWLFDQVTDALILRFMAISDKAVAPDLEHPFMKDPFSWKQSAMIQELLFTGGPVICEDVETDPRLHAEWRDYFKQNGTKRFMAVPMLIGGKVRGFIGIRHADRSRYRPEQIELTQALAHQVMLAIQLNQFAEQGQRAAVLEERNRMARDIHDTLAQGFTGVIVQLEAAEDAISCGNREDADAHLHRAGELARHSLSEARRSVHALRPRALQEHNFWDALKGVIKNTTAGTSLHTRFQANGRVPLLPEPWQDNLLRIGQEALTNTLKYAHARNFETRLSYKAKELRLELRDDGEGFQISDGHDGMGLTGMRERVEQMGGALSIKSLKGRGTNITVVLPCEEAAII